MPEFILDTNGAVTCDGPACICSARTWEQIDSFAQGYIEALFFTDTGPASISRDEWLADGFEAPEGNFPGDCGFADLAPQALDSILRDCAAFQTAAAELLTLAYERPDYDETQAGRDFWFTRNGHGVGYWDREQLKPTGPEWEANRAEFRRINAAWTQADDSKQSAAWDEAARVADKLEAESLGAKLTAACKAFPNVDSYFGDDGRVWV